MFFTSEICRIGVLIGRTIFFTSENLSYQRFDWLTFSSHLNYNACSQASVNMESDFVNSLRRDLWHFHYK